MKKFYLLYSVATLLMIKICVAQWTIVPTPSFAELRSAYFLDSQTGFVVGSDSSMLRTTNGGLTWNILPTPTDTLRCVYFTDNSTGYAVGAKGQIVKSIDGGNTWLPQVSGTTALLRSVHFPTHDTGYAAGGNGVILKTIDGGNNWMPQISGTTQDLIAIRFPSPDTGYAVSSLPTFFSGIILKTVDGGNSWNTIYTDTNGFLTVFPVTNDIVYAAGDSGVIIKSTDGGATWIPKPTGNLNRIRASFFLSADTGYVAGEAGTVLFTNDGGNTWTNQSIQTTGLLGLFFPMSDTGYVVGTAGVVIRYSTPCPLPAEPGQIFGGTTVCEGSTYNYHIAPVPDATSYTWTVPIGSVINSGQGDTLVSITFGSSGGSIVVTADNQCGSGLPHMLTATVNPLPAVPVITENGQFLVTSAASAWQWYFNGNIIPGADTSQHIPLQNGSYTVMVTNASGCTASSTPYTVLNTGISDHGETELNVAPIPFSTHFVISWEDVMGQLPGRMMTIFTSDGRAVKNLELPNGLKTIVYCRELPPGIYFYAVTSGNKIVAQGRLLKE